MASEFYMPEWAFAPPSPPEPPEMPSANSLSIPDEAYGASGALALIEPGQELAPEFWDEADRANAARVDDLNNDFVERQREILHTGDDAFFSRTGHDAVLAAPQVHAKLDALREETLGRAANDVQREWLKDTLGKHSVVEHFDIGDHVGRQSVVWQKAVNRRRLDNLEQQAAADHAIPGAVEALANASESSARDHARASGVRPDSPEAQAEVDIARSSVFRHAIEGALAKGAHSAAIKLHDRAKDKLVPGDAEILDKMIEDARETEIGRDYVAKIAPLSITINTSIEELDKAEAEATAKNNNDWKDDDTQRATNQHFIDIQFGKAKQKVESDKAKLTKAVQEWLTTPGADGLLRAERPPTVIWSRLTPEEQKGVDTVLKLNARGIPPGANSETLRLNATPAGTPIGQNADAKVKEKSEEPSLADIKLAQAPSGDNPTPEQIDEIIKKVFDVEFLEHPDFEAYVRELKKSPTFIRDLFEIHQRKGKFEFGKRAPDGTYNKGTYFVPPKSFDKEGVRRETPTIIIAPDQSWTARKKADGTDLYPGDQPMAPVLQLIQWAHEVAHLLREDGVANLFAEKVRSAADAVALVLLGEGVALWNEYSIARELGLPTIYSGQDIFDKIAEMTRQGKVDLQSIGDLYRNKEASTYKNLTYEKLAVIRWVVVRKLKHKNWQDFDWGAIQMGKSLHIERNPDGTYSVKGEVPYLPRKNGKTPPPLRISEPRA